MLTPNLIGKLYLGDVMTADPTSLSQFKYHITEAKYGTTNIDAANEIQSDSRYIYGQKSPVYAVTGYTRTYTVTILADPADETGFYDWLVELSRKPVDVGTKISVLDTYIKPDGTPALKDLFTPEAVATINNNPYFGEAGALVEVELTITPVLEMLEINHVPAEPLIAPPTFAFPNGTYQGYAIGTTGKTYGDIITDLAVTALSGDGLTDITGNIVIKNQTGTVITNATALDCTVAKTETLILSIEESGVESILGVTVQVSTSGIEPTLAKKK